MLAGVSEENRHKAGVRFTIVEEPTAFGLIGAPQGNVQGQRPRPASGRGRLHVGGLSRSARRGERVWGEGVGVQRSQNPVDH